MEDLLAQMRSVDQSTFANDYKGRTATLQAARDLVHRLENPNEKARQMIFIQPWEMLATRVALDMGVFAHIDQQPRSSDELAKATGADPRLLRRLLRLLVSCAAVKEVDVDAYSSTEWSESMKSPDGLHVAIRHHFDCFVPWLVKLPEYFAKNEYRQPEEYDNPPWKYAYDGVGFWDWLAAHPQTQDDFDKLMPALRGKIPPWPDQYPIEERLLSGFDSSRPLLIDVGGGTGLDIQSFCEALPAEYKTAKLILQDQPSVIDTVAADGRLSPQIELQAHSFFTPQKHATTGARAYFLRGVCHDWPDRQASEILRHIRKAMIPGYSKVLAMDHMVPVMAADTPPVLTALDLSMMVQFSALERTEVQWRELAESAGLEVTGIWKAAGPGHPVVEMQCSSKNSSENAVGAAQ